MSNYKYLDDNGLIYYHSKVKALLNNKVDKVSGKGLSTNDYTTTEKNKLAGIASGAEVNQNAFGKIKVGNSTANAMEKQATLELVGGTGVTVAKDTTSGIKLTFSSDGQANVIESIKVNGTAQTITSKAVDITVPTATSDLTNDSNYITSTDYATSSTSGVIRTSNGFQVSTSTGTVSANTYTYSNYISSGVVNGIFISKGTLENVITGKNLETANNKVTSISSSSTDTQYPSAKSVYTSIQDAIGSITGISFEVVQTLPSTGTAGVIYLVPNSGTGMNIYDEYVWIASTTSFEKIGSTDVDLSNYVQKTEMVTITNAEIDTIVA